MDRIPGSRAIAPVAAAFILLGALAPLGGQSVRAAELLTNGSFEATGSAWLAPWYLGVKTGAAASVAQSTSPFGGSYAAAVTVTSGSATSPWLVQLSHPRLAIAAGTTYGVTFAAKASGARTVEAIVQLAASPYTTLAARTVSVGTSWATYSYQFTASASASDAALRFNLAAATGTVWLDAVTLASGGGTTPGPTPTPAATGGPTPTPAPTATPAPSGGTTSRTDWLAPVADATVRADAAWSNYGTASTVGSDGNPVTIGYLRFDLAALAGRTITGTSLRMHVANPTWDTQSIRSAGTTWWSETGITYSNRPALGGALRTFGGGSLGSWVGIDLGTSVAWAAGKQVTLGIDSTLADGFAVDSRETANKPQLVVTSAASGGTTPTPTPSANPTATPSANPTPTPAPSTSPAPGANGGKGVSLRKRVDPWRSNGVMDSDYAHLADLGSGWARVQLDYTSSPDPAFDREVSVAKARGIRLLVTVGKPWPNKDLGSDGDRAVYRSWLGQMVNRYRYWVRDWEILNEPNLHYEWQIDEYTSDQWAYRNAVLRYLTVLQDAYGVIKGIDPGAVVHFAGLSEWTEERYLDVVVSTDAWRYVDVMGVHPYGSDPWRAVSRFNAFTSKLASRAEWAAKPIWVTEIGFNTSWSNKAGYVGSEQTKADYLTRVLRDLRSAGAALPVFWYTLHENDASRGYALEVKDPWSLSTTYLTAYWSFRSLWLN